MEPKTEIMVALAAAIGANCIPCFDHLYSKSQEHKLAASEVRAVAAIAAKVKNGAAVFMHRNIAETLGDATDEVPPCCAQSAGTCC